MASDVFRVGAGVGGPFELIRRGGPGAVAQMEGNACANLVYEHLHCFSGVFWCGAQILLEAEGDQCALAGHDDLGYGHTQSAISIPQPSHIN
jgi:hypothetical protein